MLQYVGVDVLLAEVAICVVDEDGTIKSEGTAPSEPNAIADWLLERDVHLEKCRAGDRRLVTLAVRRAG